MGSAMDKIRLALQASTDDELVAMQAAAERFVVKHISDNNFRGANAHRRLITEIQAERNERLAEAA